MSSPPLVATAIDQLDLRRPWFDPWRLVAQRVRSAMGEGATLLQALDGESLGGIKFVPAGHLPAGIAYEQYVFETSRCPTREGLHDFFNALAWLELPLTKRQLNRIHVAQIAAQGVGGQRGPVRDAATLFDENGAVLTAPPVLWDALAARDWRRLFVDLRPQWSQARLLVVGHALLEKLATPRKNLTAHVWWHPCPEGTTAEVDGWVAGQLTADSLAAKPFVPLPVLGIPGWCTGNEDISFYDDPLVFRPARGAASRTT